MKTFNPEFLVRKNVREMSPYSCARDEYEGREGIFLDANENPYGKLNRYPDPYQKKLKNAIAALKGIPAEKIFLGNGSDEILDLCFRIFCSPGVDKALTFTPSYGMYEVSAAANDVEMIKIPLDNDFRIRYEDLVPCLRDENLKLIIICSPNNPTGNCQDSHIIEKIASSFNGIILLDEAYIDFSERQSFRKRVADLQNLIVMQTMSKAFGMASARVGIAFADQAIIRWFNMMKAPYNISTLNQETVLKKIANNSSYIQEVEKIKQERQRLLLKLGKMKIIEKVFPSEANFILAKFRDADMVYSYMVSKGIIVRNRSRAVTNCLRITVGTKKENNILLNALKTFPI